MTTTPTGATAGNPLNRSDRESLHLALGELAEATRMHLAALEALNTAKDHIESILMARPSAGEGGAA